MIKKSMPELNRISTEEYSEIHKNGLVLVLDNVRSAFNVGSVFRTADGFGITKIYLCGITCQTSNRELQKTALGAEESIPSEYAENTEYVVNKLKEEGFSIFSLEQTKSSVSLTDIKFEKEKNHALILGNEVEGVSESILKLSDLHIEIPQIGTKHSLNVSNAASIVMWEFYKQMQS